MNALNGVWSDIYILQIIIQHKLENVDKDFSKEVDFTDIKFPVKIRDIHNVVKKNSIAISVFLLQENQVTSYKHKNLSVDFLSSANNTLEICISKPYDSLVFWH